MFIEAIFMTFKIDLNVLNLNIGTPCVLIHVVYFKNKRNKVFYNLSLLYVLWNKHRMSMGISLPKANLGGIHERTKGSSSKEVELISKKCLQVVISFVIRFFTGFLT